MNFPKLKPNNRKREFEAYDEELCALTVQAWLFDNKTHREIDRDILGLNSSVSKGYQSMGILHFLGLRGNTRGIFAGMDPRTAVNHLNNNTEDFSILIPYINFTQTENDILLQQLIEKEIQAVNKSRADSHEKRQERLAHAITKPKRIRVYSYVYERNPDVIAEALERAKGICERCEEAAPFLRSCNGSPYLEVHHLLPLSKGGLDTVENVKALCPNCHRELHYGHP